jgi:hypothetical protein
VHDQFSNLGRNSQAQQQYAKMAGQFCDILALAIASARHEKAANSALERAAETGNAGRKNAAYSDTSHCAVLAKDAFCHRQEGPKHGFLTKAADVQKPKFQNEVQLPEVMLKIAQIPINRAYSYHGPYSERPEVREGYRRDYQQQTQDTLARNQREFSNSSDPSIPIPFHLTHPGDGAKASLASQGRFESPFDSSRPTTL